MSKNIAIQEHDIWTRVLICTLVLKWLFHSHDFIKFSGAFYSVCINSVLYKNRFSGTIPKEFGGLTKLQLLDLRDNNLGGIIPGEIGSLLSLKRLWVNLLCLIDVCVMPHGPSPLTKFPFSH